MHYIVCAVFKREKQSPQWAHSCQGQVQSSGVIKQQSEWTEDDSTCSQLCKDSVRKKLLKRFEIVKVSWAVR